MQKVARAFRQLSSAELALHFEKPIVLILHAFAIRQLCHPLNCPFASSAPKDILSVVLHGTRRALPRVF
eukprot:8983411-Pyramimonas_sp.AAC.1